jgi:hypothetical protein
MSTPATATSTFNHSKRKRGTSASMRAPTSTAAARVMTAAADALLISAADNWPDRSIRPIHRSNPPIRAKVAALAHPRRLMIGEPGVGPRIWDWTELVMLLVYLSLACCQGDIVGRKGCYCCSDKCEPSYLAG